MDPLNLFVLVAGTNEPSNSNVLADHFIEGAKQYDSVTINKERLKNINLRHFTLEDYNPETEQEDDFHRLQQLILEADAFVIATPIWNFGTPAHLKNFIDRMGRFALDEATKRKGQLNGKPFCIIYTGGAPKAAWTGMMQFTTSSVHESLEYFGATYFSRHYEERCVKKAGEFGLVVDQRPKSLEKMRKTGYKFMKEVERFKATGKIPMRQWLKKRIMRWGEKVLQKMG